MGEGDGRRGEGEGFSSDSWRSLAPLLKNIAKLAFSFFLSFSLSFSLSLLLRPKPRNLLFSGQAMEASQASAMGLVRRHKTARERRQQRARAQARLVQHLLRAFAELASHRGGQLSRVAASLQASLASHAEIPVQGQQMEHPVTDAAPPERMEEEVLGFQEDSQRCEMQVVDTPGEVVGSTAEHKEEVIASPSVSIGKNEGEMEKPRRRRKKAKLKVDSDDDALEKAIKQTEEERA